MEITPLEIAFTLNAQIYSKMRHHSQNLHLQHPDSQNGDVELPKWLEHFTGLKISGEIRQQLRPTCVCMWGLHSFNLHTNSGCLESPNFWHAGDESCPVVFGYVLQHFSCFHEHLITPFDQCTCVDTHMYIFEFFFTIWAIFPCKAWLCSVIYLSVDSQWV